MSLSYLSPKQLNIKNHLAMLPCGDLADHKINNWNESELEPYISYILQGKGIDTMFGGLIFNPISSKKGRYIYPLYATLGKLANIEDWHLAIYNLFARNQNLHAASLFKRPLDIWVALPYPLPLQDSFGVIKNKSLNFQEEEDRLLALKWWIDCFLDRWKKENQLHSYLTFRGFVWQRDAINYQDISLVKSVNSYIREVNYLSMWLPNYGSTNVIDWQKLGFSVSCVNSNFYGNTHYDYKWINNCSAFAKYYHIGMQIYFGKGNIFSATHLTDYLNLGLPQYNNYINDCLLVYQFPNQTLRSLYEGNVIDYIRLYSFIKGFYKKVAYKNIPY